MQIHKNHLSGELPALYHNTTNNGTTNTTGNLVLLNNRFQLNLDNDTYDSYYVNPYFRNISWLFLNNFDYLIALIFAIVVLLFIIFTVIEKVWCYVRVSIKKTISKESINSVSSIFIEILKGLKSIHCVLFFIALPFFYLFGNMHYYMDDVIISHMSLYNYYNNNNNNNLNDLILVILFIISQILLFFLFCYYYLRYQHFQISNQNSQLNSSTHQNDKLNKKKLLVELVLLSFCFIAIVAIVIIYFITHWLPSKCCVHIYVCIFWSVFVCHCFLVYVSTKQPII